MVLALTGAVLGAIGASWYGPAEATLDFRHSGNPWDPEQNDVRVRFLGPGSVREERLAFFDGSRWRVRLVGRQPGVYEGEVWCNGRRAEAPKVTVRLESRVPGGFVRRAGPWGFQLDDGSLYWPLGFNLGWQSPNVPDMAQTLTEMGRAGLNWSRIWACHWDGKNPWWPNDGSVRLQRGEFWPKALDRWDQLVASAEKAGVRFQMVLFHHGQWSTRTNPNWQDNPWNQARGGFLASPVEFFTHPEAKRLAKAWLRYAVARYGHSPAILAWELFNEVEWVDAVQDGQREAVGRWMDDMAEYLRSIDPHGRLVTTSSHMDLPIYRQADYYQPHGYPPSVAALILAQRQPGDKPLFFGEVGPGDLGGAKSIQVEAVRDGIWTALFARHAGAGQYWTWDTVYRDDLWPEFRLAAEILRSSGVLRETGLSQLRPDLGAGDGGDLVLRPGAGWEDMRRYLFDLPRDADQMGLFPSYFQGKAHAPMRNQPVRFRFRASKDGELQVRAIGVASGGGRIVLRVNGIEAASKTVRNRADAREPIVARFPAGQVEVELDNDGKDWVQIGSITFRGIGPRAAAVGIGNDRLAILRIQRRVAGSEPLRLTLPRVVRGLEAELTVYELDGGRREKLRLRQAEGAWSWSGTDAILVVRSLEPR
ncbi:MAG: cellulase family glycosylhydrolase [Fimbriimonadales bacterium]|nr:cellulase family glycosylhydrolase [Fimbriimonadales bacterium]